MTIMPLVSVIIPTYKRDNLLEKAIQSVINQTYSNIEIIVVDDNDPDTIHRAMTKKILDKYKGNDKVKYIELQKNSGGCVARNTGMIAAQGKYINFLDDDDFFYSDKIENQVKKFLEADKELAVVGCFARIIDEEGHLKRVEKEEISGNVFIHQLGKNICTTSIALIDRDVCINSGGFEQIPSSQEHLFFIKIFRENPYYDFVPEELLAINHHSGERVSTNLNKPLGALALFNYVKKYFKELNESQVRLIKVYHYENIIRAYLTIGEKNEAIKSFFCLVKEEKSVNTRIIKNLILIVLGLEKSFKMKMWFKGINNV